MASKWGTSVSEGKKLGTHLRKTWMRIKQTNLILEKEAIYMPF